MEFLRTAQALIAFIVGLCLNWIAFPWLSTFIIDKLTGTAVEFPAWLALYVFMFTTLFLIPISLGMGWSAKEAGAG